MVSILSKHQVVDKVHQKLREYLDSYWPDSFKEEFMYREGPIEKLLPSWHVIEIAPNKPNAPWVYVTLGAWEITKDEVYDQGRYGLELLITSPRKDLVHVKSLAMATFYHANPLHRIKLGDVLEIGEGWMDGSCCDHFLVSLPYPFSSDLETVKLNDVYVSFWWLLPITKREAAYAQKNGQEALYEKFEKEGLDYLDAHRQSAV